MKYYALDVETANSDYSSICQIGIVGIENGEVISKWETLVNPETYFDEFNSSIHGISEDDVDGSPIFPEAIKQAEEFIVDQFLVHHTPFDRISIERACRRYQLDTLRTKWIDSAAVVRRAIEKFRYRGYGLYNVAKHFNIDFLHHNALEDAKAAGLIMSEILKETEGDISQWFDNVSRPIYHFFGRGTDNQKNEPSSFKRNGNPDGEYYGQRILFTGALSMSRHEAADKASDAGFRVMTSPSKKLDYLVVGIQDLILTNGLKKSTKHRKTETLIREGHSIRIIGEDDFLELLNST